MAKAFVVAGWTVESLAIYEPEGYRGKLLGPRDVAFPCDSPYRQFQGRNVPLVNDLLSGAFAVADDGGFRQVLENLPHRIDAIHVEQPWLWPLAERIKQLPGFEGILLIYGSQNIEAPLKQDILGSYKIDGVGDVIVAIDALEKRASQNADVAVAVTQADLDVLNQWGAKNAILAPNGIEPWEAAPEKLMHWRTQLPTVPWVLYVASAHPPNFTGFMECFGSSLGCFAPDSRLVVAGSVCEHLYRHLATSRWHSLNLSRLHLLHTLSDADLAAVKTLAHAFLLPIPHGGGSNIKTAEALYSGAHVIGTGAAFRGYEGLLDLPEVTVARCPEDFQIAIKTLLAAPPALGHLSPDGQARREGLRWDRSLAAVPLAALGKERPES
jgi:hypothetical protein